MSLLRTGHTPDAWRDEGPAVHVPRGNGGIRGNTQSGYVPFVVLPIVQSDAERNRTKLRAANLARKVHPTCAEMMKLTGEPCARRAGHRDSHRSRAVMDNDKVARRSGPGWALR